MFSGVIWIVWHCTYERKYAAISLHVHLYLLYYLSHVMFLEVVQANLVVRLAQHHRKPWASSHEISIDEEPVTVQLSDGCGHYWNESRTDLLQEKRKLQSQRVVLSRQQTKIETSCCTWSNPAPDIFELIIYYRKRNNLMVNSSLCVTLKGLLWIEKMCGRPYVWCFIWCTENTVGVKQQWRSVRVKEVWSFKEQRLLWKNPVTCITCIPHE